MLSVLITFYGEKYAKNVKYSNTIIITVIEGNVLSKLQVVKSASPQYMTFLWSQINLIRQAQSWGQFAYAMKLAASLIGYLPRDMKKNFMPEAKTIINTMKKIAAGTIGDIDKIDDVFQRHVKKQKILETYADHALDQFIIELTNALDKKNYMETHKNVREGFGKSYRK